VSPISRYCNVPLCVVIVLTTPPRGPQWESSYSGLVLRRASSLPAELHVRVQAALLTLRGKGCLLRDLVRIRERDVFTVVSRTLLGEPGHTYRYLDTRLFAIPWHSEDAEVKGRTCCDPDFRAACRALWELNTFFCSDVPLMEDGDRFMQCGKGKAEAGQAEEVGAAAGSKRSDDSKDSEGGDSEARQSEEGDSESKHSDEWDSEEGCSGSKPGGPWETEAKRSSEEEKEEEEEGESGQVRPSEAGGDEVKPAGRGGSPVAQPEHGVSDRRVEDREKAAVPVRFNVTLLNYMDPAAMSQLKEEPYYGMGRMAVGWHHDENLISHSPVAVYSHNCHNGKRMEVVRLVEQQLSFHGLKLRHFISLMYFIYVEILTGSLNSKHVQVPPSPPPLVPPPAHRNMKVPSATKNGSSERCHTRTISGSTKDLSNQVSLKNHLLK